MPDSPEDWSELDALRAQLDRHEVYAALHTLADLRCFMSHHIYSVWDFMSVVKTLQGAVAPVRVPWRPVVDPAARRLINQIVLEEESDQAREDDDGRSYLSHFELYCQAMREIGADPAPMLAMLERLPQDGLDLALAAPTVPAPSRAFVTGTFALLDPDRPHLAAAALAYGREHLIPAMFRRFLARMQISAAEAPTFHFYLRRHIHLDEDVHAPLSLRLLAHLCAGDPVRISEARAAAHAALQARLCFWDGVLAALPSTRSASQQQETSVA
jgi:hypothetical protein